ncbi:hypothetical protein FO131_19755 [Salmonella bongori]|uniref:hypothetical protein n=1 Tax=Salmonella bongori TaxID=54736 RepID=UPI0012810DD9|nr:hypothetical protein [Salmonella bongori]ECG8260409.1 hypothetical protein [Salmonella bongori serovar 48:i:-]ECG9254741.1 hypothetical protein [Salmonella bongori]EDP8708209.1 hypothetical protein [Salmonella bongori]EDP8725829.1 hypothetical protein [Salmonella bongori]EEO9371586.1 hypothetical protein [Salmonella bongori]
MLKKLIKKIVTGDEVQIYPSADFDGNINGYILIASPEDLIELVSHPSAIPSSVLRRIIISAIKRLEDENVSKTLD